MRRPITPEVYESLRALVEYDYSEERKHWQENGRPALHIFRHIKRVEEWLDQVKIEERH
jgi:hypothetical protein